MIPRRLFRGACLVAAMLAIASTGLADDTPKELLQKATEAKLSAETVADLNQVIRLCQEALAAGLEGSDKDFASEMLAGTLTQRAELVCQELFERPVNPARAQRLVQMALADLEQTLKIDSQQPEAQYLIGRLYAQLGQAEKALDALNEAVKQSTDDAALKSKALMLRANLKSDPAARQADFDEAVKLQPRQPDVLRFRGLNHLAQNEINSAIVDLKAAAELDDKDPDTFAALGVAYSMAEQYEQAISAFDKAIELAPKDPSVYTHRARAKAVKGDNAEALVDVEQALKLQPDSISALELHAQLLAALGKFDEALADMSLLLRAMPDNPTVLLQVAMLCQGAKQHKRALAAYDRTLQVDPRNVAAFRGRADVYLAMGQQAEAITDYKEALKLEPKNSGVLNNLAWVLATSPEKDLRDGKRAIELATLACEETEYKQAHILSTLAAGYAETGDFQSAIEWSKKAVELGNPKLKKQLIKELESYQAGEPWRELTPPDEIEDDPSASDGQSPTAQSASSASGDGKTTK